MSSNGCGMERLLSAGKMSSEIESRLSYRSEPEGDDYSQHCSRNAEGLHSLLNNKDGLPLLYRYLMKTNTNHYNMLTFWIACKGLIKQTPEDAHNSVKVIYTHLLKKIQFEIDENLLKEVAFQIEDAARQNRLLTKEVFDAICEQVEKTMSEKMYPSFLASEMYRNSRIEKHVHKDKHCCKKYFYEQTCQPDQNRNVHNKFVPRSADPMALQKAKPPVPKLLAENLIQKLEDLKKQEQAENEKERPIECHYPVVNAENKFINSNPDSKPADNQDAKVSATGTGQTNKSISNAFLRKILESVIQEKVEENTEDILDQQIEQIDEIYKSTSNTATDSSYSAKSVDSRCYYQNQGFSTAKTQPNVPYAYVGNGLAKKKFKDPYYSFDSGFGTFSSDAVDYSDHGYSKHEANHYKDENDHIYGLHGSKPGRTVVPARQCSDDQYSFISADTCSSGEEARTQSICNEIKQKLRLFQWGKSGSSRALQEDSGARYKTDYSSQQNVSNKFGFNNDETSQTMVVYNFNDEEMPYLLKVPGKPITLRLFKEYMPKKGNYRYFFIRSCEDLEMRPIQEEITDDNEFLPLWNGKVNAQIKVVK